MHRTLQLRNRTLRAFNGPDPEVMFRQQRPPGRMGLSDFIAMGELGSTITGVLLDHRTYHFRPPYSDFKHARIVLGVQSLTEEL